MDKIYRQWLQAYQDQVWSLASYLQVAGQRVRPHINASLRENMLRPVTDSTRQALAESLETTQEYDL